MPSPVKVAFERREFPLLVKFVEESLENDCQFVPLSADNVRLRMEPVGIEQLRCGLADVISPSKTVIFIRGAKIAPSKKGLK